LTIWPIIQKFKIGPAKAKEIATNVVHVTDWQDIVLLCFLAFATSPAAKYAYDKLNLFTEQEDDEEDQRKRTRAKKLVKKEIVELRRFGVLKFVNQFTRVALAVYAVVLTLCRSFLPRWALPFPSSGMTISLFTLSKKLIIELSKSLLTSSISCNCGEWSIQRLNSASSDEP